MSDEKTLRERVKQALEGDLETIVPRVELFVENEVKHEQLALIERLTRDIPWETERFGARDIIEREKQRISEE